MVYGLTLAPSGIDPHVNASSELGIPLTSVYDTLVYQDAQTGEFVPGLAQSWTISPDGRTYTFSLRQGVKFHDGTPFDAAAVKVNLDRIVDPATQSQKAAFMLGPYERAEVLNPLTVAVHLKEPFAPLLDSFSQVYLGMASPAALAQWGKEYPSHQVGTGPFRFVEYVPNDHLTLARNPDYQWGPSVFAHQGPAYLDEIIFRFYTDPATRAVALETGQVDVMGEMPPLDAQRLAEDQRFRLQAVAIPGQPLQLFLNTSRPPLDDRRVRQALLVAIDRQAIAKAVFGGLSPAAHGPLSAATLGYDATLEGMYAYAPDQARRLLDEAGWQQVGDTRQKEGRPLRIEAAIMSFGYVPEVFQLLQAQWRDVGVELVAQQVPYGSLLEAGRNGAVHVIPFLSSGTDPDILYGFFHSTAAFNWSKIADPEIDRWLDDARQATAWDARQALYAQVQGRIMDQVWIIPIRDYVNLNVSTAGVQGLRYDARGWFPWLGDVTIRK